MFLTVNNNNYDIHSCISNLCDKRKVFKGKLLSFTTHASLVCKLQAYPKFRQFKPTNFSHKMSLLNQEIEAESLSEQFIELGLDTSVEVLDVACGTGVVGAEIKAAGYTNVDGLDPSQGYLNGAMSKGIFRYLVLHSNR